MSCIKHWLLYWLLANASVSGDDEDDKDYAIAAATLYSLSPTSI